MCSRVVKLKGSESRGRWRPEDDKYDLFGGF